MWWITQFDDGGLGNMIAPDTSFALSTSYSEGMHYRIMYGKKKKKKKEAAIMIFFFSLPFSLKIFFLIDLGLHGVCVCKDGDRIMDQLTYLKKEREREHLILFHLSELFFLFLCVVRSESYFPCPCLPSLLC